MLDVFELPAMKEDEIDKLIQEQIVCRIAFKGEKYPIISLFQYTRIEGSLFFHFTEYGGKLKALGKDDNVCVEIEDFPDDLAKFRFVQLRGRLQEVFDQSKKDAVIEKMAEEGRRRLSTKFLIAHGFGEGSDWSSFNGKRSMTIVEFIPLVAMGLKSP